MLLKWILFQNFVLLTLFRCWHNAAATLCTPLDTELQCTSCIVATLSNTAPVPKKFRAMRIWSVLGKAWLLSVSCSSSSPINQIISCIPSLEICIFCITPCHYTPPKGQLWPYTLFLLYHSSVIIIILDDHDGYSGGGGGGGINILIS